MKNLRFFAIAISVMIIFSSCKIFGNLFKSKSKYGCPSNGKNVGAEKILSGDPDAMKAVKKAKKFKS
ncbi:MAG: hypothetical protein JST23_01340 [Bacteroidetes bacterium]|nr:hypothetical protein [Bacteroidota bacterium]